MADKASAFDVALASKSGSGADVLSQLANAEELRRAQQIAASYAGEYWDAAQTRFLRGISLPGMSEDRLKQLLVEAHTILELGHGDKAAQDYFLRGIGGTNFNNLKNVRASLFDLGLDSEGKFAASPVDESKFKTEVDHLSKSSSNKQRTLFWSDTRKSGKSTKTARAMLAEKIRGLRSTGESFGRQGLDDLRMVNRATRKFPEAISDVDALVEGIRGRGGTRVDPVIRELQGIAAGPTPVGEEFARRIAGPRRPGPINPDFKRIFLESGVKPGNEIIPYPKYELAKTSAPSTYTGTTALALREAAETASSPGVLRRALQFGKRNPLVTGLLGGLVFEGGLAAMDAVGSVAGTQNVDDMVRQSEPSMREIIQRIYLQQRAKQGRALELKANPHLAAMERHDAELAAGGVPGTVTF